eukprot:scaffold8358_cov70-Attheya_sp.AAC.2
MGCKWLVYGMGLRTAWHGKYDMHAWQAATRHDRQQVAWQAANRHGWQGMAWLARHVMARDRLGIGMSWKRRVLERHQGDTSHNRHGWVGLAQ